MTDGPVSSIKSDMGWKGFAVKTIKARKGLILIITKEDKEVTLSIKEFLERMQAITNMPELNMLPEETRSISRFTRLGMQAVAKARQQLGRSQLPESTKNYLAGLDGKR